MLTLFRRDKKIVLWGVNINYDIRRLVKLGLRVPQFLELMDLMKQHKGGHVQGYSMKALCGRYLNLGVDKFGQDEDFRWICTVCEAFP
jgi:hypothetical protein